MLAESCFKQTPQLPKALRQLPSRQRSCLVQSSRLLFEQGEVVQWIEDYRLAFIAALVPCDDFTATGDHHLVHVALHPYLAMSELGGHGVVVRPVANQRQRTDAARDLLAGFIEIGR